MPLLGDPYHSTQTIFCVHQVGALVAPDTAPFVRAARAVDVSSLKLTRDAARTASRAFLLSEPTNSFRITKKPFSCPTNNMRGVMSWAI